MHGENRFEAARRSRGSRLGLRPPFRMGSNVVGDGTPPIGETIQLRRREVKLSQLELARRSELSLHTIRRLEAGLVRVSSAAHYRLARALGVPVTYLFKGGASDP
jgi:DNA-binding XRE family transcriptional regulator